MQIDVQTAEWNTYLERCTNITLQADHCVVTGGQSYEEIECAAGVPFGILSQMSISGLAPDLAVLDKLEAYLIGSVPSQALAEVDSLRRQLLLKEKAFHSKAEEAAGFAEQANEAKAALMAERESHDQTRETLAQVAAQYAIAAEKLLQVSHKNQRLGGQIDALNTVLYDVQNTQEDLAEVLADGLR